MVSLVAAANRTALPMQQLAAVLAMYIDGTTSIHELDTSMARLRDAAIAEKTQRGKASPVGKFQSNIIQYEQSIVARVNDRESAFTRLMDACYGIVVDSTVRYAYDGYVFELAGGDAFCPHYIKVSKPVAGQKYTPKAVVQVRNEAEAAIALNEADMAYLRAVDAATQAAEDTMFQRALRHSNRGKHEDQQVKSMRSYRRGK